MIVALVFIEYRSKEARLTLTFALPLVIYPSIQRYTKIDVEMAQMQNRDISRVLNLTRKVGSVHEKGWDFGSLRPACSLLSRNRKPGSKNDLNLGFTKTSISRKLTLKSIFIDSFAEETRRSIELNVEIGIHLL